MEETKEELSVTHRIPDAFDGELLHLVMRGARLVSLLFRQTYYPLVAVFVLLNFTFLRMLSLRFRLVVLAQVAIFTIVIPYLLCLLFDHVTRNSIVDRYPRARRQVHHLITYACFVLCINILQHMHMPFFVLAYLWVAVTYQVVCLFVGVFWNISTQCAAAGSVVGTLTAYSLVMNFNAIWWLILCILICGLVASSRVLMRRHTVLQAVVSTWVGVLCGFLVFLLL